MGQSARLAWTGLHITRQTHCNMGASLSKLNELWQKYIKHAPDVYMFLCVHVS